MRNYIHRLLTAALLLLPAFLGAQTFAPSKSWEYQDHYKFTSVDLATNPHVFTNLRSDTYDYRFYVYEYGSAAGSLYFRPNSDSGTNYRLYLMQGITTGASGAASDAYTALFVTNHTTATNYAGFCYFDVTGSTGSERRANGMSAYYGGNPCVFQCSCAWQNTTNEIQSMQVVASTTDTVSGEIYVFKRRKSNPVRNAADWELVPGGNYEFSGVDLSTSPKTFSGLRGNVDLEYRLDVNLTTDSATNSYPRILINGDTGSNYAFQYLQNTAATVSSYGSTSASWIGGFVANSSGQTCITSLIKAKTGAYRPILNSTGSVAGASDPCQQGSYYTWKNSNDEITSITFLNSSTDDCTGYIRLYKRSKKRSTASHEQLIMDYDIGGNIETVAHYKCNDNAASTVVTDEDGTNGTATDNTSTLTTTGQINSALTFNGTDEYVNCNQSFQTTLQAGFSISLWLKPDDGRPAASQYFLGHRNASTADYFRMYLNTGGNVGVQYRSDDATAQTSLVAGTRFDDGANDAKHFVAVLDGSTIKLYCDGVLEGSADMSGVDMSIYDVTSDFYFGSYNNGAGPLYFFDGVIDDLRIIDRPIGQKEVDFLYAEGSGTEADNGPTDFSSGTTFKNLKQNAIYRVSARFDSPNSDDLLLLRYNGDSGSNYARQYLQGNSTTTSAGTSSSDTYFYLCGAGDTYPGIGEHLLFPRTGKYRPALAKWNYETGSNSPIVLSARWYLNTSDPIKSIQILNSSSSPVTGNIKVWEIALPAN